MTDDRGDFENDGYGADDFRSDDFGVDDFGADDFGADEGEHSGFGHYNFDNSDFVPTAFEHDLDEHEHRHGDEDLEDDAVDGEAIDPDGDPLEELEAVVAKGRHPSASVRRAGWERPTRIAVGSLALVAIMFLFVFPTRSYLAQQRQVGTARHAVQVLKEQNEQLIRQKKQLQTPGEIERLAREQFNMVLPGEQAYNVLSTATTSTTSP